MSWILFMSMCVILYWHGNGDLDYHESLKFCQENERIYEDHHMFKVKFCFQNWCGGSHSTAVLEL